MYATKIKMKNGCYYSKSLLEIDEIYLEGYPDSSLIKAGFNKKGSIHDHLLKHPDTVRVKILPLPTVIPEKSVNGEKFVRSSPNASQMDNLLSLPRE